TKGYLETQVAVLMGGRAAEELFMNHMTSGASNDIERATDIAQHMVCEWGMSALGMRAFRKAVNGFDGDKNHAMSEATARRVDEEIEKILNGGYDRALDLLNRNRAPVKAIAGGPPGVEALRAREPRHCSTSRRSRPTSSSRCWPAATPARKTRRAEGLRFQPLLYFGERRLDLPLANRMRGGARLLRRPRSPP